MFRGGYVIMVEFLFFFKVFGKIWPLLVWEILETYENLKPFFETEKQVFFLTFVRNTERESEFGSQLSKIHDLPDQDFQN